MSITTALVMVFICASAGIVGTYFILKYLDSEQHQKARDIVESAKKQYWDMVKKANEQVSNAEEEYNKLVRDTKEKCLELERNCTASIDSKMLLSKEDCRRMVEDASKEAARIRREAAKDERAKIREEDRVKRIEKERERVENKRLREIEREARAGEREEQRRLREEKLRVRAEAEALRLEGLREEEIARRVKEQFEALKLEYKDVVDNAQSIIDEKEALDKEAIERELMKRHANGSLSPEDEIEPSAFGYQVYVFKSLITGNLKIGYTGTTIRDRFNGYKAGVEKGCNLICQYKGNDARCFEKELHKIFSLYNIRQDGQFFGGVEWFYGDCENEVVKCILEHKEENKKQHINGY